MKIPRLWQARPAATAGWIIPIVLGMTLGLLPAHAADNQLDSNLQLFTVLAALNAAGFDNGLDSTLYQADIKPDSPNVARLRLEVRKALEAKKIAILPDLKK